MPKVLHVIQVAFEVETDKLSTLANILEVMQKTAEEAMHQRAHRINRLGATHVEILK